MMVAGFLMRQNSSPINGEAAFSNATVQNNGHTSYRPAEQMYCDRQRLESISPSPSSPLSDHASGNYDVQRKDLFSQRKQREFIPDNKKDESYWDRRRRNNEAAKRSREKRRFNDMILEQRVVELSKENHVLKAQLTAIKDKFGINGDTVVSVEQIMASFPSNDQVLSMTKRTKLSTPIYSPSPSPVPTSVIQRPRSPRTPPSPPSAHFAPPEAHFEPPTEYAYFAPVLPPLHAPVFEAASNSVLNLSRRAGSPYEMASVEEVPVHVAAPCNALPHKLRHKSHIGEKDAAATALLSLQAIKQEPAARNSPPWDGEGSSDERDSGISLSIDWNTKNGQPGAAAPNAKTASPTAPEPQSPPGPRGDAHLKSEVARLANEVENLKSMLSSRDRNAN